MENEDSNTAQQIETSPALPLAAAPGSPALRPGRTRILSPAQAGERPDGCLLVDTYGAFLGRHSERLRLSQKGETLSLIHI